MSFSISDIHRIDGQPVTHIYDAVMNGYNFILATKKTHDEVKMMNDVLTKIPHRNMLDIEIIGGRNINVFYKNATSTVEEISSFLFKKNSNSHAQLSKCGKYFFVKLADTIDVVNSKMEEMQSHGIHAFELNLSKHHVYCEQSSLQNYGYKIYWRPILGELISKEEDDISACCSSNWWKFASLIEELIFKYASKNGIYVDQEVTHLIDEIKIDSSMRRIHVQNMDYSTLSGRFAGGQTLMDSLRLSKDKKTDLNDLKFFVQLLRGYFVHVHSDDTIKKEHSIKTLQKLDLLFRSKDPRYYVKLVYQINRPDLPAFDPYYERP